MLNTLKEVGNNFKNFNTMKKLIGRLSADITPTFFDHFDGNKPAEKKAIAYKGVSGACHFYDDCTAKLFTENNQLVAECYEKDVLVGEPKILKGKVCATTSSDTKFYVGALQVVFLFNKAFEEDLRACETLSEAKSVDLSGYLIAA